MFPLRIAAVLSRIFFFAYAAMMGSYPLIMIEVTLLPINGYRLFELCRPERKRVSPFRRRPVAE